MSLTIQLGAPVRLSVLVYSCVVGVVLKQRNAAAVTGAMSTASNAVQSPVRKLGKTQQNATSKAIKVDLITQKGNVVIERSGVYLNRK